MQNRFGLKDFVLYVLVLALMILTLLLMRQSDRYWSRNQSNLERLKGLETQLNRVDTAVGGLARDVEAMNRAIESGALAPPPRPAAAAAAPAPPAAGALPAPSPAPARPAASAGPRDTAWARPGVEIQWQPPVQFSSDPRLAPGFREGGEITETWEAQTKNITPNISTDVYSRRIQELVLESLGTLNPRTLKIEGLLADAWQVDPEGLWLRARIRAGVRFSDGQPVTAEDVRWTFHDYVMNEEIETERLRSILRDSIAKVEVIDTATVEFTFKERLFTNVDNALSLFVLPKHIYSAVPPARLNQATGILVGSGPFKLRGFNVDRQWAPPDDIILERNELYWGPRPAVASLRYKAVSEEIARLNAFFAGESEIFTPSAPQFVGKQEDPRWLEIGTFLNWVNMRSGYSFIAWNCGDRKGKLTHFHDKRVRLAMTLALNREKMIRDIWRGVGVVAKGNQPIGGPGSNPDIAPWPYDPARALALFKETGWEDRNGDGVLEDAQGNPFVFEYTYSSGGEIAERVANFVADAYGAIGIKVVKRGVEWSVYTDLLKTRDFDAITLGWGANAPESDPVQIFHSKSIQNQGDNFAQWSNAEADRLIDQGRREMDPAKRALIWREFERVLHDEQPYTFVRVPPWLRLVRYVGNVKTYPKGLEPAEFFRSPTSLPDPGH